MHRGDDDVDGAIDEAAGTIDNDHGAILQEGDALRGFFAFAEDEDAHGFTGKNGWLHRIGQFVDIQNRNALNAGDFVEIVIIGDNFGFGLASQLEKLVIDGGAARKVLFDNTNFKPRHFLQALEHFETAASALALEGVGRISDELKFVQDEAGNTKNTVEK